MWNDWIKRNSSVIQIETSIHEIKLSCLRSCFVLEGPCISLCKEKQYIVLLKFFKTYCLLLFDKVADVSEAVRQDADALMLSGESAIGLHGQKALSVLQMVSSRMELWSHEENRQSALHNSQLGDTLSDCIAEEICNCAVQMGMIFL